jgi:hypothetical protein
MTKKQEWILLIFIILFVVLLLMYLHKCEQYNELNHKYLDLFVKYDQLTSKQH